jgi:hypothetical protein
MKTIKKILIIVFVMITSMGYAQTPITSGMTGLQLRNALNTNFDTLYQANWDSIAGGISYDNNVTVEDTLKINGNTLQELLNVDVTGNAIINNANLSFNITSPIVQGNVFTVNESLLTINDNDIKASGLRFENYYSMLDNNQDSIYILLGTTWVNKTTNGIVSNTQRGLNQNTHVLSNSGNSAYVGRNLGFVSKNQIQAFDVGSETTVGYNEQIGTIAIIGDDGIVTIDSTASETHLIEIDSNPGSEININKLYGIKVDLTDRDVGGTVNINDITGIRLNNLSGRQGINKTYGIYEDFGDNYFKHSITLDSTLYLNDRSRNNFTLPIISGVKDTINSRAYSINVTEEATSPTTVYANRTDIDIPDNGINGGKLRFDGEMTNITNNNDSLNILIGSTLALNTYNGIIGNTQRGFSLNTNIYSNGTDSSYVKVNMGYQASNQIKPRDVGSKVYVGTNTTFNAKTIIGDDGVITVDSSFNLLSEMQINSRTGSTINMDALYGTKIELKDLSSTGSVNIDNITALKLINISGRQGDLSTYGIYEDFGDNYFTNKIILKSEIVQTQLSATLTDNTPTNAEIDAATGLTPATAGAGYQITIKDSDGTGLLYRIESDGTDWFYTVMTKAL